jgi:mycothiol synthase
MTAKTDDRMPVWIEVPGAPPTAGVRYRRGIHDARDYEGLAELGMAESRADGSPYMPSASNLREEFEHSDSFDRFTDLIIGEIEGRIVASAGVERADRGGMAVFELWGNVHPEIRRRGVGRALLEANLRRAAERAAEEPPGRVVEARTYVEEGAIGHRAIVEARGFEPIRWYFTMHRPNLDDIPDAPLPAGLELRPLTSDQHRAVWEADVEAFRDHWQAREPSDADRAALFAKTEFEPELWVVAWDGDEVAGVVQPWIWRDENAALGVDRGWLERISVRRAWRGRGLGRALTAEGLRRLRDAGMTDAMLGVDADNPTGALGLYESLGFVRTHETAVYRLAMPR